MRWLPVATLLVLAGATFGKPALRHPVGLAFDNRSDRAYTANERSGTVSIVNLADGAVREVEVDGRPVDVLVRGDRVIVADAKSKQLRFYKAGKGLTEDFSIPCSAEPTRLAAGKFDQALAVSSTWGRRVEIYRADPKQFPMVKRVRALRLEFSPREMLFLAGDKQLLITDAFGGNYAIYDLVQEKLLINREIPAHNIRGLALDPGGSDILFSHQILNPLARTTFNDVHWGVLMANVVRSIPIANLRSRRGDVLRNSVLHRLGTTGPAAGDPGPIAIDADRVVIALSGVSAVLTGPSFSDLKRIEVGVRPTVLHSQGGKAFVANTFSDSLTVIDLQKREAVDEISLGKQPELSMAEKGERIFFDAKRSHNGWLSCHSCHTDGHSNGRLNDNLGDGSFGAPKRVLSLLGVGKTAPWAWNGSIKKLEEQINKSITSTMQGTELAEDEVEQLKAFLMTLEPPASKSLGDESPKASIARGGKLFAKMDCVRCHTKPAYTSPDAYDVGLRDELGRDEFNPPSLRGLSFRSRFFHDNRAESLVEVFYKHRHQLAEDLSPGEILDLSAFLRTL